MYSKKEASALIGELLYQIPLFSGITTQSFCCNGCGNSARGGKECINCLQHRLTILTEKEQLVKLFINNLIQNKDIVNELLDSEKQSDKDIGC